MQNYYKLSPVTSQYFFETFLNPRFDVDLTRIRQEFQEIQSLFIYLFLIITTRLNKT